MNRRRAKEIGEKIGTWTGWIVGGAFGFAMFLGLTAIFRAFWNRVMAEDMLCVMNWPVAFCIVGVASLLAVYYMYQQKISKAAKRLKEKKAEGAKKEKSKITITKITIIFLCSAIVGFALLMTSTNALVNIGIFLLSLGITSFIIYLIVKFFVFLGRKIRKGEKSR